ncbi:MAG: anaerobic glycerol-3-phosphate dehydrogenase subunit C [Phycisphaerae bacterium]|nr:anaerobic glycerol-3-phosphate dehydrogenase subunit C [Phycisphaerae bacterium]
MKKTSEQIGADLSGLVKGDVRIDIFSRIAFGTDASIYQILPQCVVSPKDTADVAAVVRYAAANDIPVVGRGAGSGLAGEALCDGIVLDMVRHMKRILSAAEDGSQVTVEPGVVLDDLNNYLAKYGKKIGPDPSSGNRAVVGGVVGNNSTGAHSLDYGYIADFVEEMEVVLADGSVVEVSNNVDPNAAADPRCRQLATACMGVLADSEQIIADAQPRTKRNRCGYNIVGVCHDGKIDLARLLTGSEGTLAVFTRITLRTVDVPACKALMQIEFDTIDQMARAVPVIVDCGASTCELMDQAVLKMAAESLPAYRDIFPVHCAAALLVEHNGRSQAEVLAKIEKTERALGGLAGACKRVLDANQQKRLWKSRKDAVPLLHREKGPRQPIPFMEDVSVENTRLAEYLRGLAAIGKKYGISLVYYGHAGDGELHVRPYLDLTSADDIRKMQSLAAEAFELAWSLGGTISGEHADGLLRTGFIRRQYGDAYYALLGGIKHAFDPHALMNPGKLISDDPDIMIKNLRASNPVLTERLQTNLLFECDAFRYEIEQCNGCGVCISAQAGSRLCPVHRALNEELACSRAKANLLRAWITGKLDEAAFESDEFKRILSLCVNCKMCSVQCPSGVDVSRLIMEARSQLIRRRGLTMTERALTSNRYMSAMGSMFAPVSNYVMGLRPFKWLMEKVLGIDRRRGMPRFRRGTFLKRGRRYLAKQPPLPNPIDKVAYFADSYANYNDHALGFAAVQTLRHIGIEVILPEQLPAPITAAAYGNVAAAQKDFAYVTGRLASLVRSGYKIVCSEPSAALCLKDELKHFIDNEDARLVSASACELMGYLNDLRKAGRLKTEVVDLLEGERYAYHAPCHLHVLGQAGACVELLSALTHAQITDVDAGCCGIAGTFGMQKKNYETATKIGSPMAAALNAIETKDAITECGACKMQIEHLTDKRVTHPIKLLARAYGLV